MRKVLISLSLAAYVLGLAQVSTCCENMLISPRFEKFSANEGSMTSSGQSAFNPAISMILNGQYASFNNDPGIYQLPGYMLGDEAGLSNQSFTLGESELTLSSNIDYRFYGQLSLAFGGDAEETDVSVEEAFFQTLSLVDGLNIRGGRFFSAAGYLNEQHAHAWDFGDAPLIYRGLFGNQLVNDGLQISYLLPTNQFMQLGAEVSNGANSPAAGSSGGVGSWSVYYNVGDDIGIEHSWQAGFSHWQTAHNEQREGTFLGEVTMFSGDRSINGLDVVYKWAKNGNPVDKSFKLQFEYFDRQGDGLLTINDSRSSYDGHQYGWYLQAIYQFVRQWKVGGRFDQLKSDNKGADLRVLADAGLNSAFSPSRFSAMVEWNPSEFSRLRLQYNSDQSYAVSDNQFFLQYTFSLGSHGAHQY